MGLAVEHGAVVPGIWRYELWNALIVNERRGRLSAEDARQILADLAEMRIERDGERDEARLLAPASPWLGLTVGIWDRRSKVNAPEEHM